MERNLSSVVDQKGSDNLNSVTISLASIAADIETALKENQAEKFHKLLASRTKLIRNIRPAPQAGIPADLINNLIEENKRWIEKAKSIQGTTRDELKRIEALKRNKQGIAQAYGMNDNYSGRFIKSQG